jgi:hypothetical protein
MARTWESLRNPLQHGHGEMLMPRHKVVVLTNERNLITQ